MCGIAGILRLDGGPVERSRLGAMTKSLAHRGPDGEGLWICSEGNVGLGHRRLAIIDLSEDANQPMHYLGRYTITYNGELYNYLELRDALSRAGHRFRTVSDTEVILAAYAEHGESCVERFDGMFAFAIWDAVERTLFCARDRFGEKPFFYGRVDEHCWAFASEMKALFAGGLSRRPSGRMLFHYLAHDVVQDPFDGTQTFFEGVLSLEPARTLKIMTREPADPRPRRYWQLPPPAEAVPPLDVAAERFRELLTLSLKRRLRADVPVGSSLSGGLDSSAIVCLLRAMNEASGLEQRTFSARFKDPRWDEGRHIEIVASATGLKPAYTWPSAEGLAASFEKLLYHQEEPIGSASAYAQWEIMRLARDSGTIVLLDGQGADETLAGYLHLFRPYLASCLRASPARFAAELAAYEHLHGVAFDRGWRFFLDTWASGLVGTLGRWRRRFRPVKSGQWLDPAFSESFRAEGIPFVTFTDLASALRFFTRDYGLRTLLRCADRNSMAFSREVRLPYLSHELVEFVFTLPDRYKLQAGWTKVLLREATKGVVPEAIRLRVDKIGLGTPQEEWLASPPMRELLGASAATLRTVGVIDAAPVPPDKEWRVLQAGQFVQLAGAPV